MAAPDVTIFTDPYSPWAWAAEPHLRRLEVEFGDQVRPSFVIVGLHRQITDPVALGVECVDAAAASGMPADPRVFLRDPPSSTHPAGLAIQAVAEQTDAGPYLRRLQESILLEGRRMDSAPALLDAAREVGGLNLDRLRIDFGSAAIMEAFAAHLERAGALAAANGGLALPALEVDGRGVYGWAPYEQWRALLVAAGLEPAPARPGVEEAVRRWGAMATVEVAAACDLPLPRAAAELWRLALDWRVRARTVVGGVLWSSA
jgi:predicted DsbA family dithiol-disulfide isomerase